MEDHPKRKMKTPSQLEILERVYAEDKYPSELVRSQLSAQLGLTDRQVKMWFCHRRLKDRKVNSEEPGAKKQQQQQQRMMHLEHPHHHLLPPPHPPPGLSLDFAPLPPQHHHHQHHHQALRVAPPLPPPHNFLEMMHPEERAFHMRQQQQRLGVAGRELMDSNHYHPPHHDHHPHHPGAPGSAYRRLGLHNVMEWNAELAVIRLVEEQLGEPLRDDGPPLGYEFDTIPPGAFDTPIGAEHGSSQRRSSLPAAGAPGEGMYNTESKRHSRHEPKTRGMSSSDFSASPATSSSKRKGSGSPFLPGIPVVPPPVPCARVPHEHQFIPEHPTGAHWSTSPKSGAELPPPPPRLAPPPPFMAADQAFAPPGNGFCTESRAPTLGLGFPPAAFPGEFLPRRDSLGALIPPGEVQLLPPVRPPMSEKAIAGSERLRLLHEQEQARMERKRKAEEARIAKEHEAQERRMKKEAERQAAVRRKQKEDQERKDMERLNKERQKELERLIRERAREEERIQRQHKKEFERMEKLMQKEHQRVEKLRQKEEMRREKEATKLRAAYERATAKKLAKLSTGLIDDEHLELMQMGAFVQGLVSTTGFDPSDVQLSKFPPATVRMKPPIAAAPWLDSSSNVANLFMVWRMLTNFADVIGLWPFTLDEFVQALHDYDSRLLSEIHVALLKTLVKDVKDASLASGVGSNQALAIASGGHPELVEAAYAWGFDIHDWGQHLNPLTWPEILRQFALASGYGPRWKKKASKSDADDGHIAEGKNAEEAVANIRSGAAAANAVTQMRGRSSSSRLRKQQQQQKLVLTPGTVKYAAFQVLSVEGSKGLTILEVVDRVQKAGLRDLSTSKTPEASISAVLSRDTKLFERVAPSTYCVRALHRKSPEEAEAVLQAAREKINLFETENMEEDMEEAEEEDEAEGQEAEEAEACAAAEGNNNNNNTSAGKVIVRLKVGKLMQSPEAKCSTIDINSENNSGEVEEKNNNINITDDGMEIDESQVGEVWVQGLMEGEYTELSVEERLSGLVALVEAVNQGNTVRSAIEVRYEAASALKRQLWEEVQLDKRRMKEECSKAEQTKAGDELQDEKAAENGAQHEEEDAAGAAAAAERRAEIQKSLQHPEKSRAEMKADIRLRAEKLYVIRSLPLGLDRRHHRYWQFVTCSSDPGCARIYFESHADGHWEVIDTEETLNALMNSLDTRGTRESHLFMALKEVERSVRHAMAAAASSSHGSSNKQVQQQASECEGTSLIASSGSDNGEGCVKIDLGRTGAMERFRDMERWLWNNQLSGKRCGYLRASSSDQKRQQGITECVSCHDLHWSSERHCPFCHLTLGEDESTSFQLHVEQCEQKMIIKHPDWKLHTTLPPRIQLLKRLLFLVEMSISSEAFKPVWSAPYRKAWCDRLKGASAAAEVLQAFLELESAIQGDWMSPAYETIEQVLGGQAGKTPPWIPQTTAAVSLRLMLFDSAVAYTSEQKQQLIESRCKQRKTPVKRELIPARINEVVENKEADVAGVCGEFESGDKAAAFEEPEECRQFFGEGWNPEEKDGESDDSLNCWDAPDSFEEPPEHIGNGMGERMMLGEEEEEEEEDDEEEEEEEEEEEDEEDDSIEEEVEGHSSSDTDDNNINNINDLSDNLMDSGTRADLTINHFYQQQQHDEEQVRSDVFLQHSTHCNIIQS